MEKCESQIEATVLADLYRLGVGVDHRMIVVLYSHCSVVFRRENADSLWV
jgi:hypothetical protein